MHVDSLGKIMSDDVLECFLENKETQHKSVNLYKEAAEHFADIIYPVVLQKVCNLADQDYFAVSCEYDGLDVTVSDNLNNVFSVRMPQNNLMDNFLSEVDIEINIEWDHEKNEIFDVDGYLMFVDDEELASSGLICVTGKIPSDKIIAKKIIKSLRQEIISVLVHEFRHAVQRIEWGWDHDDGETLRSHMKCKAEIDARVEEIISYFDSQEEVTDDLFEGAATSHIKKYLLRNSKEVSIEDFNILFDEMLEDHLSHFRKRRKVSYTEEPK